MRYVEKQIILQALDHLWREHLLTLDHLRQVVGWRGMAQRDPLNEYKSEAFELFGELITRLREVTTAQLSRVEVAFDPPPGQAPEQPIGFDTANSDNATSAAFAAATSAFATPKNEPLLLSANGTTEPLGIGGDAASYGKVGRNQPCPCGSGRKFKHCHGALAKSAS
jgi:preprotein translocase subunit SecA